MSINPFDEIALEEALRIKENRGGDGSHRRRHRPRRYAAAIAHRSRPGRGPRHPRANRRAGGTIRCGEAFDERRERLVKLPDIMKAKKKPLETIAIADLGVDRTPPFKTLKYETPAARIKGMMVKDVFESRPLRHFLFQ